MDQEFEDQRNDFCPCPRCGEMSLEHLKTHSHCWHCLYFELPESQEGRLLEAEEQIKALERAEKKAKEDLSAELEEDELSEITEGVDYELAS